MSSQSYTLHFKTLFSNSSSKMWVGKGEKTRETPSIIYMNTSWLLRSTFSWKFLSTKSKKTNLWEEDEILISCDVSS